MNEQQATAYKQPDSQQMESIPEALGVLEESPSPEKEQITDENPIIEPSTSRSDDGILRSLAHVFQRHERMRESFPRITALPETAAKKTDALMLSAPLKNLSYEQGLEDLRVDTQQREKIRLEQQRQRAEEKRKLATSKFGYTIRAVNTARHEASQRTQPLVKYYPTETQQTSAHKADLAQFNSPSEETIHLNMSPAFGQAVQLYKAEALAANRAYQQNEKARIAGQSTGPLPPRNTVVPPDYPEVSSAPKKAHEEIEQKLREKNGDRYAVLPLDKALGSKWISEQPTIQLPVATDKATAPLPIEGQSEQPVAILPEVRIETPPERRKRKLQEVKNLIVIKKRQLKTPQLIQASDIPRNFQLMYQQPRGIYKPDTDSLLVATELAHLYDQEATFYSEEKDYRHALRSIQKGIKVAEDTGYINTHLYNTKGGIELKMQRFEEALRSFQLASHHADELRIQDIAVAEKIRGQDVGQAETIVLSHISDYIESKSEAEAGKAKTFLALGEPFKALEANENARNANPQDARNFVDQAAIYNRLLEPLKRQVMVAIAREIGPQIGLTSQEAAILAEQDKYPNFIMRVQQANLPLDALSPETQKLMVEYKQGYFDVLDVYDQAIQREAAIEVYARKAKFIQTHAAPGPSQTEALEEIHRAFLVIASAAHTTINPLADTVDFDHNDIHLVPLPQSRKQRMQEYLRENLLLPVQETFQFMDARTRVFLSDSIDDRDQQKALYSSDTDALALEMPEISLDTRKKRREKKKKGSQLMGKTSFSASAVLYGPMGTFLDTNVPPPPLFTVEPQANQTPYPASNEAGYLLRHLNEEAEREKQNSVLSIAEIIPLPEGVDLFDSRYLGQAGKFAETEQGNRQTDWSIALGNKRYKEFIERHPRIAAGYLALATEQEGDAARETIRALIALQPDSVDTLQDAKHVLLHLGMFNDIQNIDHYMETHNLLGEVWQRRDSLLLEADIHYQRGELQTDIDIKQQEFSEAAHAYEQATKFNGETTPILLRNAAYAYAQAGNKSKALQIYLEAQINIEEMNIDISPLPVDMQVADKPYLNIALHQYQIAQQATQAAEKLGESYRQELPDPSTMTPEKYEQEVEKINKIMEAKYKEVYDMVSAKGYRELRTAEQIKVKNYVGKHPEDAHFIGVKEDNLLMKAHQLYEVARKEAVASTNRQNRQGFINRLMDIDPQTGKSILEKMLDEDIKTHKVLSSPLQITSHLQQQAA